MIPDDKKPQNDNLPHEEDRVYDLLVDGELDEDRRRTLLGSLDNKPGGWRRCALAFLEAQSWGQEFRSLSARLRGGGQETSDSSTPQNVPGKKKSSGGKRRLRDRTSTVLGIAASFLLAMGITSLMQDMNPGDMSAPLGGNQASVFTPKKIPARFFKPVKSSQAGHLDLNNDVSQEMHLMSITGQGVDQKKHTFALPAVSQDRLNRQWLKEMPTVIPDGVVESLQQAGHDVKTSRHLIPFTMRDGRKLVIPVDQVDVSYMNTPYYQ